MHWVLRSKRPEQRIKLNKQIHFLERLSNLLNKQYPLKQALEFMQFDPQLNDISRKFNVLLLRGHPIEQCFNYLTFHPLIISYIKFSVESSHFQEHISHCTQFMKLRLDLQKRLMKTLRYPLILIILSIFLFFGMSYYLFPSINQTFRSFGQTETMFILELLTTMFNLALVAAILILLSILGLVIYIRHCSIETRLMIFQRIPYFRYLYSSFISLHFAYQLHALLHSGKSVKESLIILKTQNELETLKYYASMILNHLSRGSSLYDSVKDLPLIHDELKWLINRSDEQGTLTNDLKQYANLLLETTEEQVKRLILLIQPILYMIVAVFVITIYALTIFPIYKLIQQI